MAETCAKCWKLAKMLQKSFVFLGWVGFLGSCMGSTINRDLNPLGLTSPSVKFLWLWPNFESWLFNFPWNRSLFPWSARHQDSVNVDVLTRCWCRRFGKKCFAFSVDLTANLLKVKVSLHCFRMLEMSIPQDFNVHPCSLWLNLVLGVSIVVKDGGLLFY